MHVFYLNLMLGSTLNVLSIVLKQLCLKEHIVNLCVVVFFLSLNSIHLNEEPDTHNSLEAVSELPGF